MKSCCTAYCGLRLYNCTNSGGIARIAEYTSPAVTSLPSIFATTVSFGICEGNDDAPGVRPAEVGAVVDGGTRAGVCANRAHPKTTASKNNFMAISFNLTCGALESYIRSPSFGVFSLDAHPSNLSPQKSRAATRLAPPVKVGITIPYGIWIPGLTTGADQSGCPNFSHRLVRTLCPSLRPIAHPA